MYQLLVQRADYATRSIEGEGRAVDIVRYRELVFNTEYTKAGNPRTILSLTPKPGGAGISVKGLVVTTHQVQDTCELTVLAATLRSGLILCGRLYGFSTCISSHGISVNRADIGATTSTRPVTCVAWVVCAI